jgi:nucleotide-binding universal stress UspA family protein
MKFLFGVDDSQDSFDALENLAALFLKSDACFHIFHGVRESYLIARHPLSAGTPDWDRVQEHQAQRVLDKAVSSLLRLGYKRSRLSTESTLESPNVAEDLLEVCKNANFAAVVLARKKHSKFKRFLSSDTAAKVYECATVQPVWTIGSVPLKPPHILVAVDESDYADRIIGHLATTVGSFSEVRLTIFNVMPAKPPAYWDDGHILDKSERSERQAVVKQWRRDYEEVMGEIFAKARGVLTKAGVAEENIVTKMEPRMSGTARDILAEASRGRYNILALGRRGSGKSQFDLGSRASRILQNARDCTLILVG